MAFIIKSLLTVEGLFRIFTCLIAEPIKIAFLFTGWMPDSFVNSALAIDSLLGHHEDTDGSVFVFADEKDDYISVSLKDIEAICFLPSCLSQAGTVGAVFVVMVVSIVRYAKIGRTRYVIEIFHIKHICRLFKLLFLQIQICVCKNRASWKSFQPDESVSLDDIRVGYTWRRHTRSSFRDLV